MNPLQHYRIAIIEDEMVIATTIEQYLRELEYIVVGRATNYKDAVSLIEHTNPDLALVDIRIIGDRDGVDLAKYIQQFTNTAVIYLTANGDRKTLMRAKETEPVAFLLKPFHRDDLHASIEIAMLNFQKQKDQLQPICVIFTSGKQQHKLYLHEILFVQSHGNYVQVHLMDQKRILLRSPLKEIYNALPPEQFAFLNRFVIANLNYVRNISLDAVTIGDMKFQVSMKMRKELVTNWQKLHQI